MQVLPFAFAAVKTEEITGSETPFFLKVSMLYSGKNPISRCYKVDCEVLGTRYLSFVTISPNFATICHYFASIRDCSRLLATIRDYTIAGKSGCHRLPAFSWPIREETEGQRRGKRTFFFSGLHFGDLGESLIVFWTRKGEFLNSIQLFSIFREQRSVKGKLNAATVS